ncbi:MAG: FAD:protein FMN transferase [Eubacterium sp.]|nr:FAD:protein FMN transferase [Eubacterium sp.]
MNKRTKIIIAVVVILAILAGIVIIYRNTHKTAGKESLSEEFFAMDTVMQITLDPTDETTKSPDEIMTELRDVIYRMEREFSVTDPDSDISRLNSKKGEWITVSDDTWELIKKAIHVSEETKGAFDISIYPVVKLWGFTGSEHHVPTGSEIDDVLEDVGYENIELGSVDGENDVRLSSRAPGAMIDLGACAKGYLSDVLCDIIRSYGANGIVSLGGNVQTVGVREDGRPFVVGITDPLNTDSLYDKVECSDGAVVTSGNYERYFEENGRRYHHIMDPKTGMPAESGIASVTVMGPDGFICDAYATAIFVSGDEGAKDFVSSHDGYTVLVIYKDGNCRWYGK